MVFTLRQKVLFRHCDPAGIVFFPRYFEMMNDCIEAFFDARLGLPFETLHRVSAVPTAEITTRFAAPSRHGDLLDLALSVEKVGRSSMSYRMTARCDGELRFETAATLVHVGSDGRPAPWPADLRETLRRERETTE